MKRIILTIIAAVILGSMIFHLGIFAAAKHHCSENSCEVIK